MLLFYLILTLIAGNIINDFIDNHLISKGLSPDHHKNSVVYSILSGAFALLFTIVKHKSWVTIIWFIILALSLRQLVFDTILNLLRGKAWDYVSPNPSSWVDQKEKEIFGNNGKLPNYIYAGIFLLMLILTIV